MTSLHFKQFLQHVPMQDLCDRTTTHTVWENVVWSNGTWDPDPGPPGDIGDTGTSDPEKTKY